MKAVHHQEKEQFKKLFRQEGIDDIEERFKVLDVFLNTEKHITVSELSGLLKENGYQFGIDFIKDTMNLIFRFGFAQKNRFENGEIRYEHMHLGQHHDHMVCIKCNKIVEFMDDTIESLQVKISENYGFHMLQHKMEIYGICSDCLKDRDRLVNLETAKPGERLIIKEFRGGTNARMRLLTMGLRIGDEIEIVTNPNMGQLVVAIENKRYALGKGLAKKIIVQPVTR